LTLKKEKVEKIILRELSDIIQNEVKNKEVGFCTVTGVSVTNDLSIAKIYVSFMNKNQNKSLESLNKAKGFIRTQLSRRLTIRKCPELQFYIDTSLEYGNKIEKIISELHKND
jgi:ribosome-binding factor A